MRGSLSNHGRANVPFVPAETSTIFHVPTGKAIFSTPVIGPDETIYVGSADTVFYAIDPLKRETRWTFRAGDIIDSAACIDKRGTVYVPSGDASIYALTPQGEERWRFDVLRHRTRFSPSTIYWWEANVVLGPNGSLYAGCDDFHLYCIAPGGGVTWAHRTGLHIWASPGFGHDGTVYASSFDMHVYALDAATGSVRWSTFLNNFVASSPAIDEDGTVYVGSFDGHVYALDGKTGAVRWTAPTRASIYSSAALTTDGRLLIGSADAHVRCLDCKTGRELWNIATGDAVRGSVSIGVDPEGRCAFLAYVGSGNGVLMALEPDGAIRWTYDASAGSRAPGRTAINASVALGRHGLATASGCGDIIYVPYDAYLREPGRKGLCVSGERPRVFQLPAGRYGPDIEAYPGDPIALRIGFAGATEIQVKSEPPLDCTLLRSPDGAAVCIVPSQESKPGTYHVRVDAGERNEQETVRVIAADAGVVPPKTLRITAMDIRSPHIVASFDQIGIASLSIDVCLLHIDRRSGKVAAWGTQVFGVNDAGERVGVPLPRTLFYAFSGMWKNGILTLECRNCDFEVTAFAVPLDLLRLTAAGIDGALTGRGLYAEISRASMQRQRWRRMSSLSRMALLGMLRGFPEKTRLKDVFSAFYAAVQLLLFSLRMLRSTWKPWGLFDDAGDFRGWGTYTIQSSPIAALPQPRLIELRIGRGHITATVMHSESGRDPRLPAGLLLLNEAGDVVPINYTLALRSRVEGLTETVSLRVPPELLGKPLRAVALAGTHVLGEARS